MRNYLFFFLLVSCHPIDDRLTIINNTNQDLVISPRLWSLDSTNYNHNKVAVDNFDFDTYQVSAYSNTKMITRQSWNNSFKNDTMVLVIYNKMGILKKRAEQPEKNYDVEQIFYVSKSYMEQNNWKITIYQKKTSKTIRL